MELIMEGLVLFFGWLLRKENLTTAEREFVETACPKAIKAWGRFYEGEGNKMFLYSVANSASQTADELVPLRARRERLIALVTLSMKASRSRDYFSYLESKWRVLL